MNRTTRIALLLAALVQAPPAPAQDDRHDRLFSDGLRSFREGDYASAAMAFGTIADAPGRTPRGTAACVMAAKAEYRAGNFNVALARARYLLDRYPGSAYVADAAFVAMLSQFRLGRYDVAASSAAAIVGDHPGTPFEAPARELFGELVGGHLPLSELRRLTTARLPAGMHAPAATALARAYLRQGADTLAAEVLDELALHPDGASAADEIASIRGEIGGGEVVRIAALLPLQDADRETDVGRLSRELLDGIRCAVDGYNAGAARHRRIELLAVDSGRDTATSSGRAHDLAGDPAVRAVIGPVFSDQFASASAVANARHLPIISPTATGDRLAAIGPFVFQANPDNETRGRAAARYAVDELRMSSFAVLASDEPVGRSHAEAFAREARLRGAIVYCVVYFPPDASDLRSQFLAVRRAVMADGSLLSRSDLDRPGIRAVLAASGADTLPAFRDSTGSPYVSVTALFGARGYAVAESLGLAIAVEDTTAAELDVPMVTVDGVYIALGDPGQIDYIAPQLSYFNIRAQIIGNNEWYDPERLRENRHDVDGVVFLSDFLGERSDAAPAADVVCGKGAGAEGKFARYGYDTMNLLVERIRAGERTRSALAAGLAGVEGFQGVHSPVTLKGGRVNRHLHVMKYHGGRIARVGSADGGAR